MREQRAGEIRAHTRALALRVELLQERTLRAAQAIERAALDVTAM
jgi:hypothetical protein